MRTILATLHSKFIHNSLALPCLASYCGAECGELLIREFTVHEPKESVLAQLLAEQPDVVSFSVYLWNRKQILELVDALAVVRPELRIVLGGPEVSFDEHILFQRHPGLTALVHGEGEIPLSALLGAWHRGASTVGIPRLTLRTSKGIVRGPDGPVLDDLDQIPSPFQLGLVDINRGFVYYETSRGCPFRCSFCLSARDNRVRSFSMERIYGDLGWLMEQQAAKIKLVDRTFNYDPVRTRAIFAFILDHNRSSHFHFEIAVHLLDEPTLQLLEQVPPGVFQFEIGVQSTFSATLDAIDRRVCQERLTTNILRLRRRTQVELHLDLVAGLPEEGYHDFLSSIDRVAALYPDHLQIEPVKLLPGSPLRDQARSLGIRFDPNPPYTVLTTPCLDYIELQQICEISRLFDLTWNAGCLATFLSVLSDHSASLARGLEKLAEFWRSLDLFRYPLNRQSLFEYCWQFANTLDNSWRQKFKDALGYDYARCERVSLKRLPEFFDTAMQPAESDWVQRQISDKTLQIRGQGIKLQYFCAVFHDLPHHSGRTVLLFCYLTRSGQGMTIEELACPSECFTEPPSTAQARRD